MATKKTEALKKAADAMTTFDDKLSKTQKVFPMLNLIYSAPFLFGHDTYERVIMAYKDPQLTKILADYIQYVFDEATLFRWRYSGSRVKRKTFGHENDIILMYCGIGVTDEMRTAYAKFNKEPRSTAESEFRVGPGGLHPYAIAQIYELKDSGGYLGSRVIPELFREKFDKYSRSLTDAVKAYIKGDQLALLAAIPENARKALGLKNKNYNLPEGISAEDMNKIAQWITQQEFPQEIIKAGQWLQKIFPKDKEITISPQVLTIAKDTTSRKR